tara:strand:- start:32931 stop:33155 length:225 start_codon:yes stop_codon:yes gene_type:complete
MIEQVVIGICGVTSVFLSQDPNIRRQRWACIFGLFAQPFWMYATFIAEQWGIFALSFLYAWGWARGIKIYWVMK